MVRIFTVFKIFGDLDCRIVFEPGSYISGNTGLLLTKIIRNKTNNNSNFIIVDAAMNDLIRPGLFGAKHRIIPSKLNINKILKFKLILQKIKNFYVKKIT